MNTLTQQVISKFLLATMSFVISITANAAPIQVHLAIQNTSQRPLIIQQVTPLNGRTVVPFWLRNALIKPNLSIQGQVSLNIDNTTPTKITVWNVNVLLLCLLDQPTCQKVQCNYKVLITKTGSALNTTLRGFTGNPQCRNIFKVTIN
jgi:hypothetical protein